MMKNKENKENIMLNAEWEYNSTLMLSYWNDPIICASLMERADTSATAVHHVIVSVFLPHCLSYYTEHQ